MSNISNHVDFLDFILRFSFAIACGFLIGLERQWINRVAGIQTNVLVCAGSCLFVLTSFFLVYEGQSSSRIIAQIVSGIGFLGAGMIFKDGFNAHGINTAATIWACAAIGTLCGIGLIPYALISVIFLIIANTCFRQLDHAISKNRRWADLRRVNTYQINVVTPKNILKDVRNFVLNAVSIKDHNIISVNTSFVISDVMTITIQFETHYLNYDNIQVICEQIEAFNEELIVNWSQIKSEA